MTIDEGLNIALATGFVIDDRYAIEGVLGDGGFGIVYKAYDRTFETRAAIKEFLPREVSTRATDAVSVVPRRKSDAQVHAEGVKAFLEEARRLHRLHHENIVEVTDFVHAHGTGYLVMPYYNGETLRQFLERGKTLSSAEIVDLVEQVLSALEYIHDRELLHRDISPGNLFLRKDGTVLLIDFGASRQVVGERSRSLSTIVKPGYAPFEQYHATGNQGPWTDLYALGATLYRCVIGEPPPSATERADAVVESKPDPILQLAGSEYRESFSPAILSLIDRLLAFQASSRPQSAASVRTLMPTTEDRTGARPDAVAQRERQAAPERPPPPRRPRGRRAARFAIASIPAAAVLAVGGYALYERARVPGPDTFPATLAVRSDPPSAQVFVDGDYLGATPLEAELDPGEYLVSVTRTDGYYADWVSPLTLTRNEELTLAVELAPIPDSCEYAKDNACDEPGLCPVGTDTADCAVDPANSCIYAFDGECDEPGICSVGTDTADCNIVDSSNSCTFAFDGECDEPGLCGIGTDTADCNAFFGDDSGTWANDGECDDPRFQGESVATTLLEADRGRDATDCRNLYNAGSISER